MYECGGCGAITNTVWTWSNEQLCRVCFGRKRLGDMGMGGVPQSSSMRLVRKDGTSVEIDSRSGAPINSTTKDAIQAGDASTRKIRLPGAKN